MKLHSSGNRSHVRWLAAAALVAAVALLPAAAQAQVGKVSGTINDASTGQPIDNAQVELRGTQFRALSQANGRYFIVSVPPGTYTLVVRRIGYQSVEVSGVAVQIDVTREQSVQMTSATQALAVQRIVAEAAPLVPRGLTGSTQVITQEVIQALPVTNIAGVLALQQGFFAVPASTDLTSFTDSRRALVSAIRVRGGRGGSTQTLIDGIPINNVVLGDRAFDNSQFAVSQLSFEKGGYEVQYGNALAGIVNIATLEGSTRLTGRVDYSSTTPAGALGSRPDELLDRSVFRGALSGAIPGTADRLRFAVAGQLESGAESVYQFDDDVYDFDNPPPLTRQNPPYQLDLFNGWRAGGYNQDRQLFGKLNFLPTSSTKLGFTYINAVRARQPFDLDYALTGFDPLAVRGVNSLVDTLGLAAGAQPFRVVQDVVQASNRGTRNLYALSLEQRLNRTSLQLRVGRFEQERTTCNYFQGICLGSRFADINFTGARFVREGITTFNPTQGTDAFFGGETINSNVIRADLQSQVTDHHNLQGGVFFQRHDLKWNETRNVGVSDVFVLPQVYRAKPIEAAGYLQDRIEYDFLTVKLGLRYDYGKADGQGFRNPLDPSNGTTAREVCQGAAPQFGATTPYTRTITTSAGDSTFTGLAACNRFGDLLVQARDVAQADDFTAAKARTAFSPRLGVSFPLTERSLGFFNAGRYTQNPIYNSLYQNSGVGTVAGPTDGVCAATQVKPGTSECVPTVYSGATAISFLGNPNLLLEEATQYEIGYASELGRNYSLNVGVYNRDESGLSGVRSSRPTQDIGTTYLGQALPRYNIIVNQDYLTSRGLEVQLRRRIANYWGYDVNYSYSKSTTNAQAPERAAEQISEGDTVSFRETRSEIDRPHSLNAQLLLSAGPATPRMRFGRLLRNADLALTFRYASGLPYTPVLAGDFDGFGATAIGDLNSGRGPSSKQVDLQAQKAFQLATARYGVFVRVVNVMNTKNCIQPFPTTGRCDQGTVDQRRSRQGNTVTENTNSTFFDRPTLFGERRSIFTGVSLAF
jgi:outer membrane receptor protein involved in Fe transport